MWVAIVTCPDRDFAVSIHHVCKFSYNTSRYYERQGGFVIACIFSCFIMQLTIACCLSEHSINQSALAICRLFQNYNTKRLHTWCHALCPALDFLRGWGNFPVMEARGSLLLHGETINVVGTVTLM